MAAESFALNGDVQPGIVRTADAVLVEAKAIVPGHPMTGETPGFLS